MSPSLKRLKKKYPDRHTPPNSTRTEWPIHPGNVRKWNRRTHKYVNLIEWKFGVKCTTYWLHGVNPDGSNGMRNAFDIWGGNNDVCANKAQEEYMDQIQRFLEKLGSTGDMPWWYLIYWNWMRYITGAWFHYERFAWDYCIAHGNSSPCDCRHYNHLHVQIRKGPLANFWAAIMGLVGIDDRGTVEDHDQACVIPSENAPWEQGAEERAEDNTKFS